MSEASGTDVGTATGNDRVGRRAFVAGGLGGLVASALARLQPVHADDVSASQPVNAGEDNVASATTGLTNEGAGPALRVTGADGGIRVLSNRAGLVGIGTLATVPPFTIDQAGVVGAGDRLGVLGTALPGVGAISIPGAATVALPVGVWGRSGPLPARSVFTPTRDATLAGVGVWGSAGALPNAAPITLTFPPTGVVATAFGPEQTALLAHNPNGTALQVDGGVAVNCGGTGVVARLDSEVDVEDSRIKANSIVVVTLTGDPGNKGTTLHHVAVREGGVRIVLTGRPNADTPFNYLCFELV